MAAQIGLDQVIGDDRRFAGTTASGTKDPGCGAAQRFDGYQHREDLGKTTGHPDKRAKLGLF
jgi:hypothetical protein